LAYWFVDGITKGQISVRDFVDYSALYNRSKGVDNRYGMWRLHLPWLGDELAHMVSNLLGEDIILSANRLELQKLKPYIGDVITITGIIEGDDDEGFGWNSELRADYVLDGAIGNSQNFYLVCHTDGCEYLVSPSFDVTSDPLHGNTHRGVIQSILHDGRKIELDLIFNPDTYHQEDIVARYNFNRVPDMPNSFLSSEYLGRSGMELLLSADKE